MGYFTGELLERKVVEYEFTELHGILASIADGSADGSEVFWPAEGYAYKIIPAYLESARIVLYSMLHHHRLKKQFVVKTDYSTHTVFVKQKIVIRTTRSHQAEPATKRVGSIFIPSASDVPGFTGHTGHRTQLQTVPEVPEDLSDVFSKEMRFADGTTIGSATAGTAGTAAKEDA